MPVSTADLSVDVMKNLYVDRYGISTLTEFNTIVYAKFSNKSPQLIYVKAVITDANGNWTFDDGTTSKELGSIDPFGSSNKYFTLKRAVPSEDVEDETFTITFEIYKDSGYANKIDQITKTITAYIVDFRNNANWTTEVSDFDDGTAQGWTLNLFTISDVASITADGYSAYYYLSGTTATKYPSVEKTISIPSDVSKAGLIFNWGAHLFSGWNGKYARFKYVRVYINGTKVYEDYVNATVDYDPTHKYVGWYQGSIDLTPYAGQSITIKIEFEEKLDYSSTMWIKAAIDDIIFTHK